MNQAVKPSTKQNPIPARPHHCLRPCINHGIKAGMGEASAEQKAAVECGYWCNWRYDPRLLDAGKNPFHLDSREPKGDFRKFL